MALISSSFSIKNIGLVQMISHHSTNIMLLIFQVLQSSFLPLVNSRQHFIFFPQFFHFLHQLLQTIVEIIIFEPLCGHDPHCCLTYLLSLRSWLLARRQISSSSSPLDHIWSFSVDTAFRGCLGYSDGLRNSFWCLAFAIGIDLGDCGEDERVRVRVDLDCVAVRPLDLDSDLDRVLDRETDSDVNKLLFGLLIIEILSKPISYKEQQLNFIIICAKSLIIKKDKKIDKKKLIKLCYIISIKKNS
ncbi:hypothetical protein BpHYR1_021011 [Brachionus plicatilis]|uniref:Uncharacterized protein n=1 Tax=Brachionus plicatilis TaxID=10195 RepID=A0A3M7T167_BRAPC|nr:hypothetical protein BpHYR1_021011 [Brachionus plicatilis]